jgi:hypothetical protein
MKREIFASKLCDKMESRVIEICKKFAKGNVNGASLPAFWIGLEGDICSFLKDNKLLIIKRDLEGK